jgi:demethylmenaquinone methyltransferase/2-methoxy-6-polyprenyl-1,4-benzoquinol methylase
MTAVSKVKSDGNELNTPVHKRDYNEEHFTEAAPEYDRATRMLSLGRDAVWKRRLIEALPPLVQPECLDLACGTGDICFLLAEKFKDAQIQGLDLTQEMLRHADMRNTFGARVHFQRGDMGQLPQADASIDLVTGSYALRNAPDLNETLEEIHRVLRSSGYAAFLDFSKPESTVMQQVQFHLLKFWGSFCGWWFHRNCAVHGYISESLRFWPTRTQLHKQFSECGFKVLQTNPFYGGMVELILVQKI